MDDAYGLRTLDSGLQLWTVVLTGMWTVNCRLWTVNCELWTGDYGLWTVAFHIGTYAFICGLCVYN